MRLARMLASFGGADYTASSASAMLVQSPLLTDKEKQLYEMIQRQEKDHGEVAMSWAKKHGWGSTRLPSALPALGERDCLMFAHMTDSRLKTALLLATLRAVELEACRGFKAFTATCRRQGLDELARDFALIMRDEQMHVDSNTAVTQRLAEIDPAFRRMQENAFRLTRRVYVPVIHSAIRGVE